jgi:hypothetical protein
MGGFVMACLTYPAIHNIRFSEDDRKFLADQADKQDVLDGFKILLTAGGSMSLLGASISTPGDLVEFLYTYAVTVLTDGWADAMGPLAKIQLSTALADTQTFIYGSYVVDSVRLKAPQGNARQFFITLARYYSDLRSQL